MKQTQKIVLVGVCLLTLGGWWAVRQRTHSPAAETAVTTLHAKPSLSQPLYDLYNQGKYADLEGRSVAFIRQYEGRTDTAARRAVVEARYLRAFAMARRQEYKQARELFEDLEEGASALPDKGAVPQKIGMPAEPTMQEVGAFQKTVCLSAMGKTAEAEAEYRQFLKQYPTSVLIHGAMKRVARMHGGDVPPQTEKLYSAAVAVRQKQEQKRLRDQSLCGPQVLAELLKRQGKRADVGKLAQQMQTNHEGTSLLAMQKAAAQHGFTAQGVQLKNEVFPKQKLPLVALVQPGHYVLVEQCTAGGVTVWEPPATRTGQGERKTYSLPEWEQIWGGYALIL